MRLNNLLEPFNFKVLQSVSQVRRILEDNSIEWDEFDSWLESELESHLKDDEESEGVFKIERFCPKCGSNTSVYDVNTSKKNRVDGGWSSMWFCDECTWNEMSRLTASIERSRYKVKLTKEEIEKLRNKRKGRRRVIELMRREKQ